MKYVKAVFYVLITVVCLYLIYAIYVSDNQVDRGASFGITVTFALSILTIGAAIVFPILYMISHPKSAIRALIGIVLMLVLFGIGYALSGNEITLVYEKVGFTSQALSKIIGGSLMMMYMMIAAVIAVTVYAEVRSMFK
ncbi:MAG: hypothetical protein ACYC1Q_13530 [Bacteroidia bacterium]